MIRFVRLESQRTLIRIIKLRRRHTIKEIAVIVNLSPRAVQLYLQKAEKEGVDLTRCATERSFAKFRFVSSTQTS